MIFPINFFLLLFAEAAVRSCSSKQVLLEILQYSQENIGVGVSNKTFCCLECISCLAWKLKVTTTPFLFIS